MPTIRFVLDVGERVVEADRVMSDSQVFVAERRQDGQWLRVLTVSRASVRSVERRLDRPGGWLREDVRTSAGLAVPTGPEPEVSRPLPTERGRRFRR